MDCALASTVSRVAATTQVIGMSFFTQAKDEPANFLVLIISFLMSLTGRNQWENEKSSRGDANRAILRNGCHEFVHL